MYKKALLVLGVAWLTYGILEILDLENIPDGQLAGKNVLVTGASSGIGEQMAYVYARLGANVMVTARRGQLLEKVVKKCKTLAPPQSKFGYLPADMGKEADRVRLYEAATRLFGGDLDHLILNHALMPEVYIWNGSEAQQDHLQQIFNVNLFSFVHLTGLALPSLERTKGSVAVIGSMSGRVPVPFMLEYSAGKFAMDGFFSGLRHEFKIARRNVSVTNCVIGHIATVAGEGTFGRMMGMVGTPSDLIIWLLSGAPADRTARAIISATTRRQGELYYPPLQAIWLQGLVRSVAPQFFESVDLGFSVDPGSS